MIVTWTNQSIKLSLSKCKQSASNKNVAHLYETNEREMKAFIGLWYIHGLLNWNNSDITFAYSQIYGNKILNATISIKRFWFLCANLRFDDIPSRNTCFQHDRAAAIRDLFESFVCNCEKVMHPDVYLSLDETLYPTRVGVVFPQYNKDKPATYGLLFWSINSAEVPYTHTSVIYASKPVGKPGPYYVQTTDDIVKYLVNNLTREANIKGHNLSTDRFYTSIEIANWLLEKNVTCVDTIKGNCRGMRYLKSLVNRESPSKKVYLGKDNTTLNITSYVVNTKSSGT